MNSPRPAAKLGQERTVSPERARWTRELYQGYYRFRRLGRLALVAFFVTGAVFLLWVLPWLPSGLDTDDYTPELGFTMYLLVGIATTAMLALSFLELARRQRERLMIWAAVYDEATGLHTRSYLYDRLSLERERAQLTGRVFSVLVLQIRTRRSGSGPSPMLSNATLQKVAALINRLTHPSDLVALLSGSELAILSIGASLEERDGLVERLRAAVATELPRFLDRPAAVDVIGGAATYGVEGTDAGDLVQAARKAASRLQLQGAQAA